MPRAPRAGADMLDVLSHLFGAVADALFTPPAPKRDLDEVLRGARTGDVFLFAGYGIFSLLQQCASYSFVSHCGVVVSDDTGKWLAESVRVGHDLADRVTGRRFKTGPSMVPLEDRLREYVRTSGYAIYYLPLTPRPDGGQEDFMAKRMLRRMKALSDKVYDVDILQMGYMLNGDRWFWTLGGLLSRKVLEGDRNAVCCSFLIADLLIYSRVLSDEREAYTYAPVHFQDAETLSMEDAWHYGDLYRVRVA